MFQNESVNLETVLNFSKNSFICLSGVKLPEFFSQITFAILFKIPVIFSSEILHKIYVGKIQNSFTEKLKFAYK